MNAKRKDMPLAGVELVFGTACACLVGSVMGNLGLGLALGAAFGLVFALVATRKKYTQP